jgi:hypothetical protein
VVIFRDLHLTPEQQRLIPEVVPAWLSKPMPPGTVVEHYEPDRPPPQLPSGD